MPKPDCSRGCCNQQQLQYPHSSSGAAARCGIIVDIISGVRSSDALGWRSCFSRSNSSSSGKSGSGCRDSCSNSSKNMGGSSDGSSSERQQLWPASTAAAGAAGRPHRCSARCSCTHQGMPGTASRCALLQCRVPILGARFFIQAAPGRLAMGSNNFSI